MAEIPSVLEKHRVLDLNFNGCKVVCHENLNVFIVISKTKEILVIDVNSGLPLYKTASKDNATPSYIDGVCLGNKILLTDGSTVGLRSDYNGILFLDSILQSPVSNPNDIVEIELTLSEAIELESAVNVSKKLSGDNVLFEQLTNAITVTKDKTLQDGRDTEKWSLVSLKLPLNYMHQSVFDVADKLKRCSSYIPALPVASAVCERLYALFPPHSKPTSKRFEMANEFSRSESFVKWNYVDYRWNFPDHLAQAGFFHEILSDSVDKAVCFACHSQLAYWEADELWDHEKHSLSCRFISGEYTENVPMSTVFATAVANEEPGRKIGTTSVPDVIALFSDTTVTVYECSRLLKMELAINIPTTFSATCHNDYLNAFLPDSLNSNSFHDANADSVASRDDASVTVTTCSLLGSMSYSSYLTELASYEKKTKIRIGEKEIDRIEDKILKKVLPSLIVGVRRTVPSGGKNGNGGGGKSENASKEDVRLHLVVYDIHYNTFANVKVNNNGRSNISQDVDKDDKKSSTANDPAGSSSKTMAPPVDYLQSAGLMEKLNEYIDNDLEGSTTYSMSGSLPSSSFHDQSFSYDYDMATLNSLSTVVADVDKLLSASDLFQPTMEEDEDVTKESSFTVESVETSQNNDSSNLPPGYTVSNITIPDLIQIIPLEPCMPSDGLVISGIYPAATGCHLLVVLKQMNEQVVQPTECAGAFILYHLRFDYSAVMLERKPSSIRYLRSSYEIPVDIAMLPVLQKYDELYVRGSHIPRAAVVTTSGELQLWNLQTLDMITSHRIAGEKFVSVTYCSGLEKLCVISEYGKLYYFSIVGMTDILNRDLGACGENEDLQNDVLDLSQFIATKPNFTLNDLKKLYSLIHFENLTPCFTARSPPAWTEIKQAHKGRKYSLECDDDSHTKTWKLQLGPNTRCEHLFEITLPYNAYIGHVDVKFVLRPPCNIPEMQVSLLKKKEPTSEAARPIRSSAGFGLDYLEEDGTPRNPVLNTEFHAAHNTELVCGPVYLRSYLDIPERGGVVTLTSPHLFQNPCRTIAVHFKSLEKKAPPVNTASNEPGVKKVPPKTYSGCDNIAEISITVRKTKHLAVIGDRYEIYHMLFENSFTDTLIKCYLASTEYRYKMLSLDILTWVATTRLGRCRVNDCVTEQIDYVYLFETYLNDLIRCGLINADRSLARKTVELLIILCEGSKSANEGEPFQFEIIVMNKLIEWLPQMLKCWSAGALRWFFFGVAHVSSNDSKGILLHQVFSLLISIGKELQKRKNRYHLLLRTRYGLYGCPFDAEIFEIEPYIPAGNTNFIWSNPTNSNQHPFVQLPDGGSFWNGFTSRAIDLKDLISKGCNFNALKIADSVSINQFMKGLSESEPLYFTCHSSSTNTVVEKSQQESIPKKQQPPCYPVDDEMMGPVNSIGVYMPEQLTEELITDDSKKSTIAKESKMLDNVIVMHEYPGQNFQADELYQQFKISLIPKLKETAKSLLGNTNVAKKFLLVSNKLSDYYTQSNLAGPSSITSPATSTNLLPYPIHLGGPFHIPDTYGPVYPTEPTPMSINQLALPEKTWACYYSPSQNSFYSQAQSTQHIETATTAAGPSQPKPVTTLYSDKLSYADFFKQSDEDCFPWQQLTSQPLPQMIVIDKHGGDVRFVTLDFEHPVILTDIILPPSPEVLSIAIDVWLHNESESRRIVTCSDINVKLLLLSDIQPPPVCRYAKITIVGRYTTNNVKFRVPIGGFYGHIYTASENFYYEEQALPIMSKYTLSNLKALRAMIADTKCKYELSCSKLKEKLTPLLASDVPNTVHMNQYLSMKKFIPEPNPSVGSTQIVNMYYECTTYQHHLNVLTFFLKKVTKSFSDPLLSESCSLDTMIAYSGTSKLKLIVEQLLELALHMTHDLSIDLVEAGITYDALNDYHITDMFYNLCIGEDTRIQLSVCTLLVRLFTVRDWWGHFVVNSFSTLYSSNCLKIYPRERVFALYAYMMRKSIVMTGNQTHIVEHVLRALLKNLTPLSQSSVKGFVRGFLDMELISWLLLLLIHCIEVLPSQSDPVTTILKDNTDSPIRWNFVNWETPVAHKRGLERRNAFRCFKKNGFPKKVNIEMEDFNAQKKSLQDTISMLTMYTSPQAAVKFTNSNIPKKKVNLSQLTSSCHMILKGRKVGGCSSKEVVKIKPSSNAVKLMIQKHNALPVARALIALILQVDITINIDLVVAACKVLALILQFSSSPIEMPELMTQEQLIKLVQILAWCENSRPVTGGKWASHAIVCLLSDFIDKIQKRTPPPPRSGKLTVTSSKDAETITCSVLPSNHADLLKNLGMMNDLALASSKIGEGSSNQPQLPSLLESDDSDDMENGCEDFADLFKPIKEGIYKQVSPYPTSVSVALDSRLQYGVEEHLFAKIRRYLDLTANILGYSLASVPMLLSPDKEFTFSMGDLSLPWLNNLPVQSESTVTMFTTVFDHFLCSPNVRGVASNFEELLHLWLSLSGVVVTGDSLTQQPPLIPLSVLAISKIIETVATNADVSVKLWDLTFKTLGLASFLPYEHTHAIPTSACSTPSTSTSSPSASTSTSSDASGFNKPTYAIMIVEHSDFQALITSFLSTRFPDNLVGEGVVKSFRDMLVRLNFHSIMSSHGYKLEQKFKKRLIDVLYELLDTAGAISQGRGPCDAQLCFVQLVSDFDYHEVNLSKVPGILLFVVNLLHAYTKRSRFLVCSPIRPETNNNADTQAEQSSDEAMTPPQHDKVFANAAATRSNLIIGVVKVATKLIIWPLDFTTGLTDDIQELEHEHQFSSAAFDKRITLTDIILKRYENIICNLLSTLSYCYAPLSLASDTKKNSPEILNLTANSTVGDAAYYLTVSLFAKAGRTELVMKPFMEYMSYHCTMYRNDNMVMQVSDPLLRVIIKLLSNPDMLASFIEMGGMNVICQNLQKCFSVIMNHNHSMVSLIMQYLYGPHAFNVPLVNSKGRKKYSVDKAAGGLINFAPLGTIISESPSNNPSPDILLIPSASHRAARVSNWNYNFYPGEKDVSLKIILPCAFLLREVHIQTNAISSVVPVSVSVEISRNNSDYISVNGPIRNEAMSTIYICLQQPEVVTSVLLRFYKPEKVSAISLSNIRLMGYSTFGETSSAARSSDVLSEEQLTKISLTWLSLLYYCMSTADQNKELLGAIVLSVEPSALEVICGLFSLPPPWPVLLIKTLKYVLTKLGSYSFEMGCNIIQLILRNGRGQELKCGRKLESVTASNTAITILENLCNIRDDKITDRLKIMLDWLNEVSTFCTTNNSIEFITPTYISCISSILWKENESNPDYDLLALISLSLFRKLMELSCNLPTISSLKRAVDMILCSFYYIKPLFFEIYLGNINVLIGSNSDDPRSRGLEHDYSENSNKYKLQDMSDMRLSEKDFATLASVSLSSSVINILIKSNFLQTLLDAISQFCKNPYSYYDFCDQMARNNNEKATFINPGIIDKLPLLHINNVSAILNFLAEISWDGTMRVWLGSEKAREFWPDLLSFMCHRDDNSNLNRRQFPPGSIIKLEDSVIKFFSRVCWCHPHNQTALVDVVCNSAFDPINWDNLCETSETKGLANFTKRLLLELILDEEKIFVSVSLADNFDNIDLKQAPGTTIFQSHPSLPCTSQHQLLYLNVDSTCYDILRLISTSWKDSEVYPENKAALSAMDHELDLKDNLECDTCEITVAAGVTAKDKRAINRGKRTKCVIRGKKKILQTTTVSEPNITESLRSTVTGTISNSKMKCRFLGHSMLPEDGYFSPHMSLRCILGMMLQNDSKNLDAPIVKLSLITKNFTAEEGGVITNEPMTSLLEEFTVNRGMELIAHNLPLVLCPLVVSSSTAAPSMPERPKKQKSFSYDVVMAEPDFWNTQENMFVEDAESSSKFDDNDSAYTNRGVYTNMDNVDTTIPPHSLIAFGQFLKLPNYGQLFIKDRKTAVCLLRLAIGANVDLQEFARLNKSHTLATLSFSTLSELFKSVPLAANNGVTLRRYALELGAVHIVLACLAVFTHHPEAINFSGSGCKYSWILNIIKQYYSNNGFKQNNEKADSYWAKGTGFGTGSTSQSWNVEQALSRQKYEEDNVVVFLQIISYYINPDEMIQLRPNHYISKKLTGPTAANELLINSQLPSDFETIIFQSCLLQALSSYLHNDSVLDMARHVPLYQTILSLVRSMAVNSQLLHFLLPQRSSQNSNNSVSLIKLLLNVKSCIDTYTSKLKNTNVRNQASKKKSSSKSTSLSDCSTPEDEGLAQLIPAVQSTIKIIEIMAGDLLRYDSDGSLIENSDDMVLGEMSTISIEKQYIKTMKSLQFDSHDMISEVGDSIGFKFNVVYHFASNLKADAGKYFPARMKRLAQEATTLSTSLPLSYSSSVFVRYDTERLDLMKVLMTGPAETPYENGCFEFDVYFPPEYPSVPMLINLETTGRHTVRFNPNLYNDGKVCLSILNTWHGRPEEKWNQSTSSFLQVLVSIQSLILVPEPYFNEPGYERSRGTTAGDKSSRDYNSNIYQATVKWAMLQQLRAPSPCFKQVIQTHFWFKRNEIVNQLCAWITDMEQDVRNKRPGKNSRVNTSVLKNNFKLLCDELEKLPIPSGLDELASLSDFKFIRPDPKFLTPASTSAASTSKDGENTIGTESTSKQTTAALGGGASEPTANKPDNAGGDYNDIDYTYSVNAATFLFGSGAADNSSG